MDTKTFVIVAEVRPRPGWYDSPPGYEFDLSGLDMAQANDLVIDAACRVSACTGGRLKPSEILRSAAETAPPGM